MKPIEKGFVRPGLLIRNQEPLPEYYRMPSNLWNPRGHRFLGFLGKLGLRVTRLSPTIITPLLSFGSGLEETHGSIWELQAMQWRLCADLKFREGNGGNHGCCG